MTDQVSSNDCYDGTRIVNFARDWIGTPYRHQSSCKGAGADCLGLLRGVWRDALGGEPEIVPSYTSDWGDPSGEEMLLEAARRNLVPVADPDFSDGNVALMRMRDGGIAKHVGILATSETGHRTIIHAYSGHGVLESPLTPSWERRIAAFFRYPGRRD